MMRRLVIVVTCVLSVAAALFIGTHLLLQSSDAYATSDSHVRASTTVANEVKEVSLTSLAWFDHAFVNEQVVDGKASGDAELALQVVGQLGTTKVLAQLSKDATGWHVVRDSVMPNPALQRTAARPLN